MQNSRCFWLIAFAFLKKLEYEWEKLDIIFSTLSSTFAWKKKLLFLEILVQKLQLLFFANDEWVQIFIEHLDWYTTTKPDDVEEEALGTVLVNTSIAQDS